MLKCGEKNKAKVGCFEPQKVRNGVPRSREDPENLGVLKKFYFKLV